MQVQQAVRRTDWDPFIAREECAVGGAARHCEGSRMEPHPCCGARAIWHQGLFLAIDAFRSRRAQRI